jgi:hypothetical protein
MRYIGRKHVVLFYYDKTKTIYKNTNVYVVCLCNDHINMFSSGYIINEMTAILSYTNEFSSVI